MGRCSSVRFAVMAVGVLWFLQSGLVAAPPKQKTLSSSEEAALRTLITAVDTAQQGEAPADSLPWDIHVLESASQNGYLPFTIALNRAADTFKPAAMYVRAVPRRDGQRVADKHSIFFEWLTKPKGAPLTAAIHELVSFSPSDMPLGGPALMSVRRSTSMAGQNSTILGLREKEVAAEKAADAEATRAADRKRRDPRLYPFEAYYPFDMKLVGAGDLRVVQRALALPPGEYDVFVALVDRARLKERGPAIVLSRTVTVPGFVGGELALGSLILVEGIRTLPAPFEGEQQSEHPYAFGGAELVPVTAPAFATADNLSVVFQICNYRAPMSNLTVFYDFYSDMDGTWIFFNQTEPQDLADADLPPPDPSNAQAFVMQVMPLQSFPPGRYVLEVTVEDHVSQLTRKSIARFAVGPAASK